MHCCGREMGGEGRRSSELRNTYLQRHLDTRMNQQQLRQSYGTDCPCYRKTHTQHPQNIGGLRARCNSEGRRYDNDGENGAGIDSKEDIGALSVEGKEDVGREKGTRVTNIL
jgi:hypothetical protein